MVAATDTQSLLFYAYTLVLLGQIILVHTLSSQMTVISSNCIICSKQTKLALARCIILSICARALVSSKGGSALISSCASASLNDTVNSTSGRISEFHVCLKLLSSFTERHHRVNKRRTTMHTHVASVCTFCACCNIGFAAAIACGQHVFVVVKWFAPYLNIIFVFINIFFMFLNVT
jgi:hypothetical protein